MRLASLKEFRELVYTPDSAPAMSTLRGRIDRGLIPGGRMDCGRYMVDLDEFERVEKVTAQLEDKRERLAKNPVLEGLI